MANKVATTDGAVCDSSSCCAIVLAVITGRVMSTARNSRCIAATRLAASREVLASTVRAGRSGVDRLPLLLRLRSADKLDRRAPFELSGSGPLFEDGSVRLDLLARGPAPDVPAIGERDEYRLNLRGERFQLRLGDQRYALTPLTEIGRYGFGAGGELRAGNWTARGHLVTDRRLTDRRQLAASIDYAFGSFGSLGLQQSHQLRVTLIPVQYQADGSNRMPDTSAGQIEQYRQLFMKLYPTTQVVIQVGPTFGWGGGINMCGSYSYNGLAFARSAGMNMAARPRDGHYYGYTDAPAGSAAAA